MLAIGFVDLGRLIQGRGSAGGGGSVSGISILARVAIPCCPTSCPRVSIALSSNLYSLDILCQDCSDIELVRSAVARLRATQHVRPSRLAARDWRSTSTGYRLVEYRARYTHGRTTNLSKQTTDAVASSYQHPLDNTMLIDDDVLL
ncbi:hypothetical protein ACJJTC_005591 [Scirpophaga incertulas]